MTPLRAYVRYLIAQRAHRDHVAACLDCRRGRCWTVRAYDVEAGAALWQWQVAKAALKGRAA